MRDDAMRKNGARRAFRPARAACFRPPNSAAPVRRTGTDGLAALAAVRAIAAGGAGIENHLADRAASAQAAATGAAGNLLPATVIALLQFSTRGIGITAAQAAGEEEKSQFLDHGAVSRFFISGDGRSCQAAANHPACHRPTTPLRRRT